MTSPAENDGSDQAEQPPNETALEQNEPTEEESHPAGPDVEPPVDVENPAPASDSDEGSETDSQATDPPRPAPRRNDENPPVELDMSQRRKEGGIYCRCCCDYARAVLFYVLFTMIWSLLFLVNYALGQPTLEIDQEEHGGEVLAIWDEMVSGQALMFSIGVFFKVAAVPCVIRLETNRVAYHAAWTVVRAFLNMFLCMNTMNRIEAADPDTNITLTPYMTSNFLVAAFSFYAHMGYIWEVRKGTLSPTTYPREEYCCFYSLSRARQAVSPTAAPT